ncbi:MAG: hypothetical protein PHG96_06245 [Kiritimatiellae bacterium]|nr:hypothetical protein [Kiritimatiellia bacterium]
MVLAATPHIGVAQGFYPEILIDFKKRAKIAVDASRNSRLPTTRNSFFHTHKTHGIPLQTAFSKTLV